MAGTVTVTKKSIGRDQKCFAIIIDWTSSSGNGGAADGNIASLLDDVEFGSEIVGNLKHIETAPGANGDLATNLPTADYDITIKDDYSLEIEALADRSGTAAELVEKTSDYWINSELALAIAAAGDGKQGRIILFFER